jgi:regulatory subunit for Cdc7p protein kinase
MHTGITDSEANFEQHVISRQHRKFAMDDGDWKELDDLLTQLGRPMKDE